MRQSTKASGGANRPEISELPMRQSTVDIAAFNMHTFSELPMRQSTRLLSPIIQILTGFSTLESLTTLNIQKQSDPQLVVALRVV